MSRSRLPLGEKDLLAIVRKNKYEPNYRIFHYLNTLIQSMPLGKIENDIVNIADSLEPHISANEGLISFGNVLMATNEVQKALIVYRLNTMLYPGSQWIRGSCRCIPEKW